MNRILQKIPFLRLLTALVIGIFAGSLINAGTLLIWLLSLNILIILIFAGRYYNYCMAPLFGVLTHLVFISIGIMLYQHHNSRPVFYKEGKFRATVMSIPREKKTNWQCLLRLDAFYSGDSVCATKEKILGSFEKDEVVSSLIPGQRIYFYGNPRLVQNRGNPFEFDYKRYLSRKKIYRKVYLPADKWMKSNESKLFTPALIAERFRMNLLSIYERMPLGKAESHILSAITLGYKSNIEPETKNLFLSAGAMHILAVSGLHVGIIYLMLSYIFGFLKSIKAGRPVFSLTVIFVLWLYALITGLSPSVMRATMMLSFVVVGDNLRSYTNTYNTLTASAFFLLIINPNNLFDAGFQLSYAAVFGIVFLQPRLVKLVRVRYLFIRYFWIIITVSFSVQITTFPLSIYYFDQFPLFFWLSGLFMLPVATILIPLGFLLLIFNMIPCLSNTLACIADCILGIVFQLLGIIEKLPLSVIRITLSLPELILIYFLIIFLFIFILSRKTLHLKTSLVFMLLVLVVSLITRFNQHRRNELIVYNSDDIIVHLITGNRNYIISEKKLSEEGYINDMILNTKVHLRIDSPSFFTLGDTYSDEHIFLKKNYCCFEGRIFRFGTINDTVPEYLTPEIIVGSSGDHILPSLHHPDQLYIQYDKKINFSGDCRNKIYYLHDRGAFMEKW